MRVLNCDRIEVIIVLNWGNTLHNFQWPSVKWQQSSKHIDSGNYFFLHVKCAIKMSNMQLSRKCYRQHFNIILFISKWLNFIKANSRISLPLFVSEHMVITVAYCSILCTVLSCSVRPIDGVRLIFKICGFSFHRFQSKNIRYFFIGTIIEFDHF